MREGNPKVLGLAVLFVLVALGLTACGSGNSPTTVSTPAVSRSTAEHLAKLSERVATDLDSGDTCHAAHAADDLSTAVQQSDLPANLRPAVDDVATRLVDEVNCPPPPPPAPEKKPKPDKHGDHPDHQGDQGPKPPGHGGHQPPGHAKLGGEG
jgi:hypothetical protein